MTPRLPAPLLAVALAAAVGGVAASPASAEEAAARPGPDVVSVEVNDTPIDAWGGWVVWSRRTAQGTYQLVARRPDGVGLALPVDAQAAPIDASIGRGPDGGPLIVYTRCAKQTGRTPTGCDVLRIDPRTGLGGPVPAASQPGVDERFPAVWGTRIAFSRTVRIDRPQKTGIAVAALDGPAPARATIFGPRSERRRGRDVPAAAYGTQGLDLRGGTLAYTWHTKGAIERWQLNVRRGTGTKGAGRTVVRAASTRHTITRLGRPALSAHDVIAPRLSTGSRARSELVRSTFGGRTHWTLRSGFSSGQTERYGSALTAVARPGGDELVVLRRLASDGRWSCRNAAAPEATGCELLQYSASAQRWRRVAAR